MVETIYTESAGGIIFNPTGEIALVKNGPLFWGFPKGHIDEGEDALSAARREISEETGLTQLSLVRELPSYGRYKGSLDGGDDMSEYKTMHMYLFMTREEELVPTDPNNPEAEWVVLTRVRDQLTNRNDKEYFSSIENLIREYAENELGEGRDGKDDDGHNEELPFEKEHESAETIDHENACRGPDEK